MILDTTSCYYYYYYYYYYFKPRVAPSHVEKKRFPRQGGWWIVQSNGQIGPDDCPLLRPLIHRGTAVAKFQTLFFSIENDVKLNEKCSKEKGRIREGKARRRREKRETGN